jgi:hypothetical protein
MFDFLRNSGHSEEAKQQETLNAYLDGQLSQADRERFEDLLASSAALREELQEMSFWQQQMRTLPRRRVPRNFTLDPVLHSRPQRRPLAGAYPLLRGATALAALMLVIAVAANVFVGNFNASPTQDAASVAMSEIAIEEAPAAEAPQMQAEMAAEAVEEESIIEEPLAAEEAAPTSEAEQFILEEPLEAEAEALPAEADEAALLPQTTRDLSPALELVEETVTPPLVEDGMPASADAAAMAPAEKTTGAAPAPDAAPEQADQQISERAAVDESPQVQTTSFLESNFLALIALALGLLFIILVVLTLIARAQRW